MSLYEHYTSVRVQITTSAGSQTIDWQGITNAHFSRCFLSFLCSCCGTAIDSVWTFFVVFCIRVLTPPSLLYLTLFFPFIVFFEDFAAMSTLDVLTNLSRQFIPSRESHCFLVQLLTYWGEQVPFASLCLAHSWVCSSRITCFGGTIPTSPCISDGLLATESRDGSCCSSDHMRISHDILHVWLRFDLTLVGVAQKVEPKDL